jgi:hypothetical protein
LAAFSGGSALNKKRIRDHGSRFIQKKPSSSA